MKLIATDELVANPRKVLNELEREGSVVITENGQPKGILSPTNAQTVLEDIQEQIRGRARRAVSEIRRESAKRGLDKLTMNDINREIAVTRKARRGRQPK